MNLRISKHSAKLVAVSWIRIRIRIWIHMDLHHWKPGSASASNKKQDLDPYPDPHQSDKLDSEPEPDPHQFGQAKM